MTFNQIFSLLRTRHIKVWVEQGELKYKSPQGAMTAEIREVLRQNKRMIIDSLESAALKSTVEPIAAVPRNRPLPASFVQQGIWISTQYEAYASVYNMVMAFEVLSEIDLERFRQAIVQLANRHEALRTNFIELNGELQQVIHDEIDIAIQVEDAGGDPDMAMRLFTNRLRKEYEYRFDLKSQPLFKIGLIKVSRSRWYMWMNIHHIISDGWSSNVFFSDFTGLYRNRPGEESGLPPLDIHYADYASWQRSQVAGAHFSKLMLFWKSYLKDAPDFTRLPTQKASPVRQSFKSGAVSKELNAQAVKSFLNYTNELGLSPYMAFLSVYALLVFDYSQQDDIIIGTATANRSHVQIQALIGCFVNVLPLRFVQDTSITYTQFATSLKQNVLSCFRHQEMPFDKLVEELDQKRKHRSTPLVQLMFNMNTALSEDMYRDELLQINPVERDAPEYGNYDMQLAIEEKAGAYWTKLTFNTELYDREFIDQLTQHYANILTRIADNPDMPVADIDYISTEEKHRLLTVFNDTGKDYPHESTIAGLFEQQVRKTPGRAALVFEDTLLSYEQLNRKADLVSVFLRDNNTGPDDLVGVMLDRSEYTLIAIIGILKAGAAYVPLDPEFPRERKKYIVDDTRVNILITHTSYIFDLDFFEGTVFAIDVELDTIELPAQLPAVHIRPGNLAYVMYTSGSTGNPKGVMVEHRNVVRLVKPGDYIPLTGDETLLSTGAFSFDATSFEYWSMLLNGGCLVMCSQQTLLNPEKLAAEIGKWKVDTMWFTAGWLNQLVDTDIEVFSGLKTVIAGGDRLSSSHIALLMQRYPGLRIVNGYGPTENTTFSLTCTVGAAVHDIPVGKPVGNSTAYITDAHLKLLPMGVSGEIQVGGAGVARGYLNSPELTTEKFLMNPFKDGDRLYRTGDLGKWMPDGNILFMGRKDGQVKIRGFRVECGEIEHALQCLEYIDSAVVTGRTNRQGEMELVAYFAGKNHVDVQVLKSYLGKTLPACMVPSHYLQLDKLPLTGNGKVDKKSLPDPEDQAAQSATAYIAPRNATEQKLIQLWQEILGTGKLGVKDDFFDSGGHSLKATRLASMIHKEFDVQVELKDLFTHTVLEQQAQLIQEARKTSFSAILAVQLQASYPVTSSQLRLWVLSQIKEGNIAYNVAGAKIFEGRLNIAAFDFAFGKLIERHEILRTVFRQTDEGDVRQVILPQADDRFQITNLDIRQQKDSIRGLVRQEFARPFDLASGPLLRAGLYRILDDSWVFIFTMHHIISDGWSLGILTRELLLLYKAYTQGEEAVLKPLGIQYKDYASWQQERLQSGKLNNQKAYWLKQFDGALPVLDLQTDFMRPVLKTYNGAVVCRVMDGRMYGNLKLLCEEHDCTLFMCLLASVNALLYKYTNQEDIIVGTPIAGREHADLDNQAGLYLNTIALRTRFDAKAGFIDLLHKVKQTTLGAYQHQAFPFDELVAELNPQTGQGRNALFDVMVILQNTDFHNPGREQNPGDFSIREYEDTDRLVSKFDLTFEFEEREGTLQLAVEYNNDLYRSQTIEALVDHLEQLTAAVIGDPALSLDGIDCLTEAQKRQVLVEFNDTRTLYPGCHTVVELFEAQAARTPAATALLSGEWELSYAELNERVNRLSAYLMTQYELRPDQLVGIRLKRDGWMVVAILAVLKSGAAYLPIDPDYPKSRIDFIISDSQCKLVIDEAELHLFRQSENKYHKSNAALVIKPGDLAYVMYTSGSTGMPKGVMIEHRNTSSFLYWCRQEFGNSDVDIVYGVTSICFDLSVFEIFYPLTVGKKLRLLENALAIPDHLEKDERVLLNTVPSVVSAFLNENIALNAVTVLNMAGEPVPVHCVQGVNKAGREIRNLYGPTEDTTYSTMYRIIDDGQVFIGKPIANKKIYILNESLQPQPPGVAGEIYTAGDGVARGYLNNPVLTGERFVSDPFETGKTMYRTGDMARWLPDGNIQFYGRKDDQVKIRGYRIELGEIEIKLREHPAVSDCVVVAKNTGVGDKALVAYLVGTGKLSSGELRNFLLDRLPRYMIPEFYAQLDALPLTPNGKLDKKALPSPVEPGMLEKEIFVAPTNETEKQLAAVWRKITGRETVGIHDNFFETGGNSLKVMTFNMRLGKEFGIHLAFKDFYLYPSISKLAHFLTQQKSSSYDPIPKIADAEYYDLAPSQARLWLLCNMNRDTNISYNIPVVYKVQGYIDLELLRSCLQAVMERHEILRTTYAEINGKPVQKVHPAMQQQFRIDTHVYTNEAGYEAALAVIKNDMQQPFDLEKGPVFRSLYMETGTGTGLFLFTIHHIACDGWSLKILMDELFESYIRGNMPQPVPAPLNIQFKEYAAWQLNRLENGDFRQAENYWAGLLSEEVVPLKLPVRDNTDAIQYRKAGTSRFMIQQHLLEKLEKIAAETNSTLYMVLTTGVYALLYQYTGNTDIIIGTPVSSRLHPDLENQVGFYLNMLPLRVQFSGDGTFKNVLEKVKDNLMSALTHQEYPFEKLLESYRSKGKNRPAALFGVVVDMIDFYPTDQDQYRINDSLKITMIDLEEAHFNRFDLTVYFHKKETYMEVIFEFNPGVYRQVTVDKMAKRYLSLLHAAADNGWEKKLGDFLPEPAVSIPSVASITDHQNVQH